MFSIIPPVTGVTQGVENLRKENDLTHVPVGRNIFSCRLHSLDFEALKMAVRILRLVGFLAHDGPKPPGIIDDGAESVHCNARERGYILQWELHHGRQRHGPHGLEDGGTLTRLPSSLTGLVVALLQHEKVDHVWHVVISVRKTCRVLVEAAAHSQPTKRNHPPYRAPT